MLLPAEDTADSEDRNELKYGIGVQISYFELTVHHDLLI